MTNLELGLGINKNNFDNYDYLNTKDINRIRFYNLLSNIEIMGV